MENSSEPQSAQLIDKMLPMAFGMWLAQLHDKPIEHLQKRATVCSKQIAEKGDVLMYGSKKAGGAGEVFNRLAEGMACLTLISKHPVPFGKLVFHHTGEVERFESEKEANDRVWPSVPEVQEDDSGPQKPEEVRTVRQDTSEAAAGKNDSSTDQGSEEPDRNDA